MIRTNLSLDHIPITWIFEYYCKLNERLHGQDVRIRSLFNPDERTPSMFIYMSGDKYLFKDHSSGHGGDGVMLVMRMFNLTYDGACIKILQDYDQRYEEDYEELDIVPVEKYKITSYEVRQWTIADANFWTPFNIGSRLLEKFNVKPLSSFTMSKSDDNITIKSNLMYGYFDLNGDLIKVYQPSKDKHKFFTSSGHIQGADQLEYKHDTLVICSSLKDVMSLLSLGFNLEAVASGSEGILIPKSVLSSYALKYKHIYTLLDNDKAGKEGMQKYTNLYGIPGIYLNLSKDISDSVRDYGAEKVRKYLKPFIK